MNTAEVFQRVGKGCYRLRLFGNVQPASAPADTPAECVLGKSRLILADCMQWLGRQAPNSLHAVVTDPPFGLVEYSSEQKAKLRTRKGGIWRIPPAFDGHTRAPLPRFTVLNNDERQSILSFFLQWGRLLYPVLVPGSHVIVASNTLFSYLVSNALASAGFEKRGEIVRLVRTLRGGDRPKNAHNEFPDISVMCRSMWEPWVVFRKPIENRVQDNLRKWNTGAFRRPSTDRPFGDVIKSHTATRPERKIAPHPTLKPQDFLRQLVRAVLPLGKGIVLDPFAGSGSTLAAAEAVGYESVGVELDKEYFEMAKAAVPKLSALKA
jgi:site-specific DNA-methyltransferase (adenine-specific)